MDPTQKAEKASAAEMWKTNPNAFNKLMKGSLRYGSGLRTAALEAQGHALLC